MLIGYRASHEQFAPSQLLEYVLASGSRSERRRRINVGTVDRLPVDQAVQQVQHERFGRHARIQCQFHSPDDNLFVMMKDKREDIDHLTITGGAAKHLILQLPKG